ncbi:hypothetical protein SCOR_01775 [Sulfidibacter corallicola]|uniref:Uncharacterized protein n=1 Tax=Sulfidibacter corallicola TaxID=2818388 RepID=A0A8A4THS1_SULCO|nr:hypothetical protein [Sulfidibacter corallicola]QTD48744.1 hypothetical protein J3U87_24450 [Sulfidibacter corallicola]
MFRIPGRSASTTLRVRKALRATAGLCLCLAYLLASTGFQPSWLDFRNLTETLEAPAAVACCCKVACRCGDACPGTHEGDVVKVPETDGPSLTQCAPDGWNTPERSGTALPPHVPGTPVHFVFTGPNPSPKLFLPGHSVWEPEPRDKIPIAS